jgi:tetratricopeptide (TPR) repeat protein
MAAWVLALACAASNGQTGRSPAPLLDGLDSEHFVTESIQRQAGRFFDQGMLLAFGFNPAEAARSFEAATILDPACATCWWALAWSLGPTINSDMEPGSNSTVQRALRQARRYSSRTGAEQRVLIDALSLRHRPHGVLDEEGYARRMSALARRYPRHGLIAMLAAEALMNLHPYEWWTRSGDPQPWTPEIEALLQRAMSLEPRLAGAHHYWIHLQESSLHPERAVASAEFLRQAIPGSGHLLHMPSHIDMRTGHFDAAIAANQRSIEADKRYLAQVDAQGAYRVGYVAHNHHFLWAAASMAGRSMLALQAAQAAWPAACGPDGRIPGATIAQHYAVLPLLTRVRFGQWEALLHDTLPPDSQAGYPLAIWRYARGTAYARSGQLESARRELQALEEAASDPSLEAQRIKNLNPAAALVRMAVLTLRADLALADHDPDAAAGLLEEAARIEDSMQYDEPHLWLAPSRQAWGAALLAAGRAAHAEQVYREDLAHYPDNGWSLNGLALALTAQGRTEEAQDASRRAHIAWQGADRVPAGSRF